MRGGGDFPVIRAATTTGPSQIGDVILDERAERRR